MHDSCLREKKSGQNWKILFTKRVFCFFVLKSTQNCVVNLMVFRLPLLLIWTIIWNVLYCIHFSTTFSMRERFHFFFLLLLRKYFVRWNICSRRHAFYSYTCLQKKSCWQLFVLYPKFFFLFFFHFLINPQSKFPSISRETRLMGKNSFIFHLLY